MGGLGGGRNMGCCCVAYSDVVGVSQRDIGRGDGGDSQDAALLYGGRQTGGMKRGEEGLEREIRCVVLWSNN
ncbi:hypothetical protein TSUD_40250 [Trifolium subterraneum]|uniref:Uncharacterized protein n=1 Tax=Trifolium subterraneum TaxID=3900 RepID=A0A2Z6N362_TRISU|nr:hypothetical protein TSUD_40250 [Trifolium subterraneum]